MLRLHCGRYTFCRVIALQVSVIGTASPRRLSGCLTQSRRDERDRGGELRVGWTLRCVSPVSFCDGGLCSSLSHSAVVCRPAMDRIVAHFSFFERFVGYRGIRPRPIALATMIPLSLRLTHALFDAPFANQSISQLNCRHRALTCADLLPARYMCTTLTISVFETPDSKRVSRAVAKRLSQVVRPRGFPFPLSPPPDDDRPHGTAGNFQSGRHPIVETIGSVEPLAPNDVYRDGSSSFQIIQSPNMSGNSTCLPQVGLLTVLAMCRCFVPAEYANFRRATLLPLVRIF
ncbi:DNA-MISMATCH-REPAIR-2 domain-containing protein [Mycena venus]|uniref:DNA-MISMATCH-REPAIR-2 domain-containing protein n=1 Tax=Mycena venus TaxID=2733690 RepID=A0A8H7CF21_9AGAR|nr:DNA-MISMATCH-REPAIR-2 domain-containing protein [Mycena venus]